MGAVALQDISGVTGTAGQFLSAGAGGQAKWATPPDTLPTLTAGTNIDISGTQTNPIINFATPTTSNILIGVGTELQAKDDYDTPNFAMSIDSTGLNDKYDVGGVINQEDIAVSSTTVVQTLSTTDTSNYQNSSVLTCGTSNVIDQKTATEFATGYTAGAVVSCSPSSIQIGGGITYPIPSFPDGDGNISMNVAVGGGSLNPSLSLSASAPFQPSYSTIIDKNGITQNNNGGAGFTINSNAENITLTNTGRIDLQSTNLISDANKLEVRSTNVGGTANPLLVLKNTNTTAGGATFETYKDDAPTSTGSDPVGIWTASCNTNIGKTEITRISAVVNGVGAGNNDGGIILACKVNSSASPVNFINCNGGAGTGSPPLGEVQFSKPINMFGQNIITTSGDMTITAFNSTGTGNIDIQAKGDAQIGGGTGNTNVYNTNGNIQITAGGVASDLEFNCLNWESGSAGGTSGQHLRIKLNGTYYKIKLEND
jgi:hypothetical protein